MATPKRRGRPRIDPAAELQEILDLRDRGLAAKHAGDDDALSSLEDVTERLTKRMTRLRKWGREGEESAAHDAARSQKLRGEVFGQMVGILTRTGRTDDAIVCEFHGHHFPYPQRMLRTDRFKLVVNPESVNELYDLERDPDELHNRFEHPEMSEVRSRLSAELYRHLRERGDNFYHWMTSMDNIGQVDYDPSMSGLDEGTHRPHSLAEEPA